VNATCRRRRLIHAQDLVSVEVELLDTPVFRKASTKRQSSPIARHSRLTLRGSWLVTRAVRGLFFRGISPADAVAGSLTCRALNAGKAFSEVAMNSVRA
jgi:hypothetical protein